VKEPLRKRFATKVKSLRLGSGLSQEAFADKCGFARSYVSRIERGGANPSLDAIEVLAVALGVRVATLFDGVSTADSTRTEMLIMVPFAADGTCFNPSLTRTRTGRFTVGKKGSEVTIDGFGAAVEYLKSMNTAYWRRPNDVGNWGIVVAVRWDKLPSKFSKR
jgi:transcriptional regulator with XRE-family HTH domain